MYTYRLNPGMTQYILGITSYMQIILDNAIRDLVPEDTFLP